MTSVHVVQLSSKVMIPLRLTVLHVQTVVLVSQFALLRQLKKKKNKQIFIGEIIISPFFLAPTSSLLNQSSCENFSSNSLIDSSTGIISNPFSLKEYSVLGGTTG